MSRNEKKIVLVSLTDIGKELGQKIISKMAQPVEHLHKPGSFTKQIQECFKQGHPLLFICATGIVVRTLAPIIKDKLSDPPVLVLDQKGMFVIPLLSGHEGGANQWGNEVANLIGAQIVITSAKEYVDQSIE